MSIDKNGADPRIDADPNKKMSHLIEKERIRRIGSKKSSRFERMNLDMQSIFSRSKHF